MKIRGPSVVRLRMNWRSVSCAPDRAPDNISEGQGYVQGSFESSVRFQDLSTPPSRSSFPISILIRRFVFTLLLLFLGLETGVNVTSSRMASFIVQWAFEDPFYLGDFWSLVSSLGEDALDNGQAGWMRMTAWELYGSLSLTHRSLVISMIKFHESWNHHRKGRRTTPHFIKIRIMRMRFLCTHHNRDEPEISSTVR